MLLILTIPLLTMLMASFSLSFVLSFDGFCYCNDLLLTAVALPTLVEFNWYKVVLSSARIMSLPLNSG